MKEVIEGLVANQKATAEALEKMMDLINKHGKSIEILVALVHSLRREMAR